MSSTICAPSGRAKKRVKTPEQIRRNNDLRRQRKDARRPERERRAEEVISAVQAARAAVPDGPLFDDWRAELDRAADRIRKSGKRTPDRDLKAVEAALASELNRNGATAADLSGDTAIPELQVAKVLDALIALGAVYKVPKEAPAVARGARVWIYHRTGRGPSTDMVLP